MPETFIINCGCPAAPGTTPPSIAPYVVSVNGLQGILTLGNTGAIVWTAVNNTLFADLSADAGLGSVTSVAIASNTSNLTVVSGSPITTLGTITLDLAGNVGSIADLVMAADQTIYSTGPGVFVATSLTAFGRSLIDDAAAVNARSTLGLVIGTDVQAFSQDLADFVTNASWTGANLTLAGSLTLGLDLILTVGDASFGNDVQITGGLTGNTANFTGAVLGLNFTGIGTGLTALNATNLTSGTVAVARGGTGLNSYTTGQVLYASGATTIAGLTAGAAGTFLRFAGAGVAPVVSTLILPNAATVGDIFSSSTTNTMSRITAVATGNALISGGVATLPSWGKITSSHVDSTIPTMSAGVTSDLQAFTLSVTFQDAVEMQTSLSLSGQFLDSSAFEGVSGMVFTSTGSGTAWADQVVLSTLNLSAQLSLSGTITAAGVTGNRTINKQSGTVRFAAAATTIVITNSLALAASSRALATVCTNDATLTHVKAIVTDGFITLIGNNNATGETEVYWELRQII